MNSVRFNSIFTKWVWRSFLLLSILVSPVINPGAIAWATTQPSALVAEPVDGCPFLNAADASALLQEKVQPQAVGNLLFATSAGTAPVEAALCGYVSQSFQRNQQVEGAEPFLATQVQADHAVVTAKLLMGQHSKLLPLIDILRHSAGTTDPSDPSFAQQSTLIQSLLWAGNTRGMIDYLDYLAQDNPHVHTRHVGDLGEVALWVWIEFEDNNFAMMVDGEPDDYNIIAALMGKEANEQVALGVATQLALQMEGEVAHNVQGDAKHECEFLSHAEAMAILNLPLSKQTDQGAGLCGYGDMAQQLGEAGPLPTEGLPDGIASGVLAGEAAKHLLQRLADTLVQDNPAYDQAMYERFQSQLAAGDWEQAHYSLNNLMDLRRWRWGRSAADHTQWLVRLTDEAEHVVFLTMQRPDGHIGFIIAKLQRQRMVNAAFTEIERDASDLLNKPLRSVAESPNNTQTTDSPTSAITATDDVTATQTAELTACSLLSAADAEILLGEAVRPEPVQLRRMGLCGYFALAPGDGNKKRLFATSRVVRDEAASETIAGLLDELTQENSQADKAAIEEINFLLEADDWAGAIGLLPDLLVESSTAQAEVRDDVGSTAVALWGEILSGRSALLIVADHDGNLIIVSVQLRQGRDPAEVVSEMVELVRKGVAR